MENRIILDDPDYKQQIIIQDNKAKGVWILLGIIALIITAIVVFTPHGNNKDTLNGEYFAQLDVAANILKFSSNGEFARFSRTFGDWELTKGGKYSIDGSTLVLCYSDGKIRELYYDSENDTITEEGYIFRRLD